MHCFISYMACLNAYRTESQSYSVLKIRVPGAHAHVRSIGLQRSLQEKVHISDGHILDHIGTKRSVLQVVQVGAPVAKKKPTFSCKVHLVKCWVCEGSNYTNYSWDFMGVVKCCKSSKTASIPICLLSLWSPTSIFATKVTPKRLGTDLGEAPWIPRMKHGIPGRFQNNQIYFWIFDNFDS